MKAFEIMQGMFEYADCGILSGTCDSCKAGDPEVEVKNGSFSIYFKYYRPCSSCYVLFAKG